MKCSLGISHFLKEISAADAKISSLSHSIVFLCFFALIAEECFLISPCSSLELSYSQVFNPNNLSFPLHVLNIEGHLAVTSVTPLIARIDWADAAA